MKLFFLLAVLATSNFVTAQELPYYYNIPAAPASYTPELVAARMVDGLGFRYFWATEGLTQKEMIYRPTPEARSLYETIEHINGLVIMLRNAVESLPNNGASPTHSLFNELREQTLLNLQEASMILKKPGADLKQMEIIFERTGGKKTYPFWNMINGPVEDAVWHTGQVVSFRRSAGNPIPAGVNEMEGKKQ